MKNHQTVLLILLGLLLAVPSFSQTRRKKITNRFAASIIAGGNFSQVDGDRSSGFDKTGWYGGIRGTTILNHRLQWNIELLFSQKGSKLERQGSIFLSAGHETIQVDYVEVPVLLKIFLKKDLEGIFLEFGASYSRQVRLKIEEEIKDPIHQFVYNSIAPDFNKNELSLVSGIGLDFEKHFSIGSRFSFAATPLYQNQEFIAPEHLTHQAEPVFRLRNYFVSLFAGYHF